MADNKNKIKNNSNDLPKNPLIRGIRSLTNITKSTNTSTYGVSRDIADTLSGSVDDLINKIGKDNSTEKNMINAHMTKYRLSRDGKTSKGDTSIYNLINDASIVDHMQGLIGGENVKFVQLLKDYEIIKRCIPQVHKVISDIKDGIISPDAMTDSAIGIEFPTNIDDSDKDRISKLIEKYDLNSKLNDIVLNYLIASVDYYVPVPYSSIPDMLSADNTSINECISELESDVKNNCIHTLYECTHHINNYNIISESAINLDYVEDDDSFINSLRNFTITNDDINKELTECMQNIEFIKGGTDYFKTAVLNEAVALKNNLSDDTSMKTVLKNLKKGSNRTDVVSSNLAVDGLVDPSTIKDIRKNVNFKGCHIERLDPSRVMVFKLRNTIIGYFYVEDISGINQKSNTGNISSIMDKINASVYMKHDESNKAVRIQSAIIKNIADKMIEAIDSKFINDNYEDMDILYEFIKVNELHTKKKKRVVFFHPDDVCEFKRKEGSIMKNCMFMAKLYILTTLSNVLTNVTRGADRNIHYVKTGLTTDIEQHVNHAIRAIKQGQIRYSDIGTINEIFNIVGANVDVFMPVSVDGERPIDTETISGQNVDMNNDFLNSILKSIIQSFGAPSSIIDDYESADFAKTITMSNLNMAKLALAAQNEINPILTKLFRLIISYEIPEFTQTDDIFTKLNPPMVIVMEMNKDRVDSIDQMSKVLSELYFPLNDQETESERLMRLFRLEYFKKNMPTIDWDELDQIVIKVKQDSKTEEMKNELKQNNQYYNDSENGYNNDYYNDSRSNSGY